MLKRLSMAYSPVEDRIDLTMVQIRDGVEVLRVFALTRRVCNRLRQDLHAMRQMAQDEPQSIYKAAPGQAARSSATGQPSEAEPTTPGAAAPPASDLPPTPQTQLVRKAVCARRRSDGRWIIRLHHGNDDVASLLLSDDALGDLASGLESRIKAAQWGLPALDPVAAVTKPARALH